MKDTLIENGPHAAQEGLLAAVVAQVVGLAAGLLIGVHSILIWDTIAGETSLWHSGEGGEILAWLSSNGA